MLDAVYETIRNGEHGVLMIDAPTGCGKTSCISAAMAAAPGKVVVALRTVSQIGIYTDEIQKIWSHTRHKPEIAYMVGKQKICPIEDEFRGESVYAGCSRLKEWTKNYITSSSKQEPEQHLRSFQGQHTRGGARLQNLLSILSQEQGGL